MRKLLTIRYQYNFEDMKISSISSLFNIFIINCQHLANDSSCRHCTSDCLSVISCSGFTCSKQYFKSCSKILI